MKQKTTCFILLLKKCFFKGIWEEIWQHPVQIKFLKSIIKGDDLYQFEIILPEMTQNKWYSIK